MSKPKRAMTKQCIKIVTHIKNLLNGVKRTKKTKYRPRQNAIHESFMPQEALKEIEMIREQFGVKRTKKTKYRPRQNAIHESFMPQEALKEIEKIREQFGQKRH